MPTPRRIFTSEEVRRLWEESGPRMGNRLTDDPLLLAQERHFVQVRPGTIEISRVDNWHDDAVGYRARVPHGNSIQNVRSASFTRQEIEDSADPAELIRQRLGAARPLDPSDPVYRADRGYEGDGVSAAISVPSPDSFRLRSQSAPAELRRWQDAVRLADSDGLDMHNRPDSWRDPPGRWRRPRQTAVAEMALPPDGHEPEDL